MKDKIKGDLMLLTTAIIWGTAFVAQKEGMDMIGPIAFNGIRTVIGGIVLIPVLLLMSRKKGAADVDDDLTDEERAAAKKQENKLLVTGGIICGLALMLARQYTAGRTFLHNGRQGRLHHTSLRGAGTSDRHDIPQKKDKTHTVALCTGSHNRALSALHPFRRRSWRDKQGRYDHAGMRSVLCVTYTGC